MQNDVNEVRLSGRLTRDVKLEYTANGTAKAFFTVAINNSYRDKKTGEYVDKPEFVDVICWKQAAEWANQSIRKGNKIMLEGRLTYQSWNAKDGQRKTKLIVTAFKINPEDWRTRKGHNNGGSTDADTNQPAPTSDESDLPF